MPLRPHIDRATQDYILGGLGITAPAWMPSMSDVTEFFTMLTVIGGALLIGIRLYRQWKFRNHPPSSS